MADFEQQLRQMADHRAAQVQPYEPPRVVVTPPAWRRSRALAAMAACFVVLAVAAGWAGWSAVKDDDGRATGVTPTTSGTGPPASPAPSTTGAPSTTIAPSTTAPATISPPTTGPPVACTRTGSTARQQGTGVLSSPPKPSVLTYVDVQTSTCVDEVSFAFQAGLPDWTVEYREGPFVDSPRGEPLAVDGRAFLVVRMEHAAGADLTVENPRRLYTGPLNFRPGAPSELRQLAQLEDFESQIVWVIGLDARQSFTVAGRDNRLVVTIQTQSSTRDMTCTDAESHFRVRVPDGVMVYLTAEFHCRLFGMAPFVVIRNSDVSVPIEVSSELPTKTEAKPAAVEAWTIRQTTIDGRVARVFDGTWSGGGFYSAGSHLYYWEIEWTSDRVLRIGIGGSPGATFDANKAAIDALAASARHVP